MKNGADQNSVPLYKVHMPTKIGEDVIRVLYSGQIANGPDVSKFEALLGDYIDNPLVTATSDISSSLTLCLFLAGVRPGDDVLMSPLVCLSTSCPVRNLFANIRWCDVDPRTGNLDPHDLVKRITPRSKAILVYHWAGYPADLDAIHAVARANGLAVIEDAGEALGAEFDHRKIGATGSEFAVFSFYPNRQLTTIEGGAISFAREENYEKARWLKRYGICQPTFRDEEGEIDPTSDIPVAGWNASMNRLAATIGVAQMNYIRKIVSRHQENGLFYDQTLADIPGVNILKRPGNSLPAFWVYTFLASESDRLRSLLRKEGIKASKVHLRNDYYTAFGNRHGDLPGVEFFSRHCLSIPCGWWVTDEDRGRIVEVIRQNSR
jgi:dTDP-4-amino-4,6-dideoxygalactose transaminase